MRRFRRHGGGSGRAIPHGGGDGRGVVPGPVTQRIIRVPGADSSRVAARCRARAVCLACAVRRVRVVWAGRRVVLRRQPNQRVRTSTSSVPSGEPPQLTTRGGGGPIGASGGHVLHRLTPSRFTRGVNQPAVEGFHADPGEGLAISFVFWRCLAMA